MNFGEALELIKTGRFLNRPVWGHRVYVFLEPGADIITISHNGYDSPWNPPHPDLLADDWQEIIPHP